MEQPPVQPFEDPALKAALRRALDRPTAPAGLRDRIAAMAVESRPATAPQEDAKPIPMRQPRGPLYKFAIAAILVLGFGSLAYQVWQMNKGPDYSYATAVPDSLYASMLQTHTARASGSAGGDSVTSFDAASGLASQINRPVFAADLAKDGWTYRGGAVRNVGSHSAAQLFFTKGKAAVSVFSLPAAAAPDAKDGMTYERNYHDAPIAGFLKGKGLYCIVGSSEDGSLTVDEVKRLLEAHRRDVKG
jgi:hypothetical protein